jgi:hypothetical protein
MSEPDNRTVGQQVGDAITLGDFVADDKQTVWHVVTASLMGFVPYAGQVADFRDTVAAVKKVKDEGGWASWANLGLVGVGWIPGIGDAAKGVLRPALRLTKKGATKVVGEVAQQALKRTATEAAQAATKAAAKVVKAVRKPFTKIPLTPAVKARCARFFGARRAAMRERDRLEKLAEKRTLSPKEADALSAARADINAASRQLGEKAGETFVQGHFKDAERIYPPPGLKNPPSRPYEFDQVYKAKDPDTGKEVFVVVEAKGGGSPLGTREAGGVKVEQGTPEYFDATADSMKKSGDPNARAAAQALEDARRSGDVRYFEARAPIGTRKGEDILKDFEVNEFDMPAKK